jgi:ribosomal protein L44E
MPEHYPKNVTAVSKWCPTCKRLTMHRVDYKRVGACTEHAPTGLSKDQEKRKSAREQAEKEPTFKF